MNPQVPAHQAQNYSYCADQLHEHDWENWLNCLFAPSEFRAHLHALFAFSAEIKRIPFLVSEPQLGEIRLQYWRDVLSPHSQSADRNGQGHPLAEALLATIAAYDLPVQPLLDLIDAHVFDLYQDPMPSMRDLEGYCGETIGAPLRLASMVLAAGENPGGADCIGHACVSIGLVHIMHTIAIHAARSQIYLPKDILIKHSVDPNSLIRQQMSASLQQALREIADLARHHSQKALADLGSLKPQARSVILGLALIEPSLTVMQRKGWNPFQGAWLLPGWKRQWHVWRMSLKL